jgi:hypothetical protein
MAADIAGKTVQVLDLMLEFFADERHWLKHNYAHPGRDQHCLVGAVMHFSARLDLPDQRVISLLEAALPRRQMGLITFNDDHGRTIAELRALIRKARTFALENAEHERAAADLKRRFLAELEQERNARRTAGKSPDILYPDPPEETAMISQRLAA